MNKSDTKVPPNLVLASVLSSSITIVVSIIYIVLCSIALVYRYDCDAADISKLSANQVFWATTYIVYIQNEECGHELLDAPLGELTQPYTVFVLTCLTLSFSVLTLITACMLLILINKKDQQYIDAYVYAYIGSWVGSLVVDVTLATHVGMDYTFMTNKMMDFNVNYEWDMIRQGAIYIMSISLKAYVTHAINLVLICCMIVYLYDYRDMTKREEHAIHKVGAINAFDHQRRNEDTWLQPDMYFGRGINNSYPEEPRHQNRNDYYNNARNQESFRRSDSWNHQPPPQPVAQQSTSASRPFSYLEEIRRAPPLKPVSTTADGWRGAWPPVPAPDYSPHTPRRLKSALKPAYM